MPFGLSCFETWHASLCMYYLITCGYAASFVLAELGVLYWKLDADNWQTDPELKKIRQDRGYTYEVSHFP